MKRTLLFAFAILFLLSTHGHAQQDTPEWLRFLGKGTDGNNGVYSCTSGTCALGDERWYKTFNVSAGATAVSLANNGPFVIRATGTCTVAGTISNSVNTGHGGGVLNAGDFGGAGGGGGGGKDTGYAGLSTVADGNLVINSAGRGGEAGSAGGSGQTPTLSQYRSLLAGGTFWAVGGSNGGRGGANGSGIAGGKGGNGGGPVILVCQTINFTGTIDVSGAPGQPAPADNTGGGGGGGGGYVILSAVKYVANSGTIKSNGGAGGGCGSYSGCGPGGAGGNGWHYSLIIH